MTSDSTYRTVMRCFLATMWTLTGRRPHNERTLESADKVLAAALGPNPDVELRTAVVCMPADGLLALGGASTLLAFLSSLALGPWPLRAGVVLGMLLLGMSAASSPRWSAARSDRGRWVAAGRPAAWTPSAASTPTDRDAAYWGVGAVLGASLGVLFASGI